VGATGLEPVTPSVSSSMGLFPVSSAFARSCSVCRKLPSGVFPPPSAEIRGRPVHWLQNGYRKRGRWIGSMCRCPSVRSGREPLSAGVTGCSSVVTPIGSKAPQHVHVLHTRSGACHAFSRPRAIRTRPRAIAPDASGTPRSSPDGSEHGPNFLGNRPPAWPARRSSRGVAASGMVYSVVISKGERPSGSTGRSHTQVSGPGLRGRPSPEVAGPMPPPASPTGYRRGCRAPRCRPR
jgi:hypothetical protein